MRQILILSLLIADGIVLTLAFVEAAMLIRQGGPYLKRIGFRDLYIGAEVIFAGVSWLFASHPEVFLAIRLTGRTIEVVGLVLFLLFLTGKRGW